MNMPPTANGAFPRTGAMSLPDAIARADVVEGRLKAFVHRPAPAAYDTGRPANTSGPLAGVPVAVKDLIDTMDMPTAYGSKIFQGHRPAKDAWIVGKLREAGAVIFGKTVTTEFAWRDAGATVNPWNTAHSPGGSSSGSAAAVGAGIVEIALGTQTVGSIIRPASYCGAVGYKPTYGLIPTDGVHPLAPSLDHLGFITASVHWAAVCHAVIAQGTTFDPAAFDSNGTAPRRVGLYRSSQWAQVDADVQQNFDATVRRLSACGVEFVDVDFDLELQELNALTSDILAYEARACILGDISGREASAGPYTRELVDHGASIGRARYETLIALLGELRANRDATFKGLDAIISITSPTTALRGLSKTGDASFCAPATLLGLPAVTVPSGFSAEFLPFGVQLIGPGHSDLPTLKIAQWLSTILPAIKAPSWPT